MQLASKTDERHFDKRAAIVPPEAVSHHGDTVLVTSHIVRLIFLPLPVVVRNLYIEMFTQQRPFPAADVIIQTNPEGPLQVFGHVVYSAQGSLIKYGGQVTVLGSAVALSFSPAHPQMSDKDVLMDIVCVACMRNNKVISDLEMQSQRLTWKTSPFSS